MFNLFKSKKSTSAKDKPSIIARVRDSLANTRNHLTTNLSNTFLGKKKLDKELLEQIEDNLLMCDLGMDLTEDIIQSLTDKLQRKELDDTEKAWEHIQELLLDILIPCEVALEVTSKKPFILLMVGINGAGKTTTLGKIAKKFQNSNHSCLIAAGDTFRAAAIEQLSVWGERNNIPVIKQKIGSDPASVIFDAIGAAKSRGIDVVLADTAGRLHTQDNLMEELAKIKRVIQKQDNTAPHETLLVLDASIGQNALNQALEFHSKIGLTGLIITKLDGTAKGGIIFAIAKKLGLPIRYIGIGEGIDDLCEFNAKEFVSAMFTNKEDD